VISEALLDADFTLEAQNVSMGNRVVEVKYFYRFIPVSFTQSELNEFVKEINKITKSSTVNTVVDDFIKIGAVTSTFLNHGEDPKQSRSKRGCYVRWLAVGCETNPNRTFGIGAEVTPSGIKVVLRFKKFRIKLPVLKFFGKRAFRN